MLDDVRDLVGAQPEVDRHEHAAEPLTPKNEVNKRAELCDTIAMRSPVADAERVEPGGLGAGPARDLTPRARAPRLGRLIGLVDDADPLAVHELGALHEVVDGQRNLHTLPRLRRVSDSCASER